MLRIPRNTFHAFIGVYDVIDSAGRSVAGAVGARLGSLVERGRHRVHGTANAAPTPAHQPVMIPNLDRVSAGASGS